MESRLTVGVNCIPSCCFMLVFISLSFMDHRGATPFLLPHSITAHCITSPLLHCSTTLPMIDSLQPCVTAASALALLYSVSLNAFRHYVYEEKGLADTAMDLVLNAAPLAVSRLLVKHCDDAIVCNMSE